MVDGLTYSELDADRLAEEALSLPERFASELEEAALSAIHRAGPAEPDAVAGGLQRKFDWAGVAASGIGAGVGQAVGQHVGLVDASGGPLTARR